MHSVSKRVRHVVVIYLFLLSHQSAFSRQMTAGAISNGLDLS